LAPHDFGGIMLIITALMKAATDPLLDGEPEIFRYKDILLF
jgi:hypothetical protein